MKLVSNFLIRL